MRYLKSLILPLSALGIVAATTVGFTTLRLPKGLLPKVCRSGPMGCIVPNGTQCMITGPTSLGPKLFEYSEAKTGGGCCNVYSQKHYCDLPEKNNYGISYSALGDQTWTFVSQSQRCGGGPATP